MSRHSVMGARVLPTRCSGHPKPGTILQGGPIAQKRTQGIQASEVAPGGCRECGIASGKLWAAGQQRVPGSSVTLQAGPEAGLPGQPDAQSPSPAPPAASLPCTGAEFSGMV